MIEEPKIDLQELIRSIRADNTLSKEHKDTIEDKLREPTFFNKLIYGGFGAALASAIAKYLELSKKARILVTIAGYGVGRMILNQVEKEDKFVTFNPKTNLYEIK
jgi:prolipoprotein diacylglyceryltransferase